MPKQRKFTDEQLIEAVKNSYSLAEVLRQINLVPAGGNYRQLKYNIKKLGLSTEHFLGQSHLKGKSHNWAKKIPLEDILVDGSNYGSDKLKQRLIKASIFSHKCYECNLTKWRDKPIPLELEHKNGNNTDNRIENLTLLCPNCHAQTDTYRGKNISTKSEVKNKTKRVYKIDSCVKNRKTVRPSYEQLTQEIQETSYLAVGKKYGVSDNAIRKWIRYYQKHMVP